MAATARQFLIEFTLRVLRYGSDCVCGVLHLCGYTWRNCVK